MSDILLTYVKPHVQEDPLAMVLGITYLGAVLERAGIDVELIDERIATEQEVQAAIARARICGFSALTPNVRRAIRWARYAREQGKITVMGGPHASVDPQLFLDSGGFDYVLQGEGETTIVDFVRSVLGTDERALRQVEGIAFDRSEERIVVPAPALTKDLDEIPFPARHLLPQETYFAQNPDRLAYVFTTRGCPYRCTFCQKELTGRGYRVRSIGNIVDEVEQVVRTYDPGSILFIDEIFTLRKGRIYELCDEIRRRDLRFQWVCNTRADCVDYPMLKEMYAAGCRRIYYGWESGSQKILDVLQKDLSPQQIIETAKMTRRAGIWTKVFLIVGSPGETMEDVRETQRVLKLANPDLVRVSVFNPLVGTPSWDQLRAYIDVEDLADNYVSSNRSAYCHDHFTQEELETIKRDLVDQYQRWYHSWPQRTRRYVDRVRYYVENPEEGWKRVKRAFRSGERPVLGKRVAS
ncbi:MAG: B12-binding domain-containing radical SAM protein [Planctomycetes bacterium]|nr:B12-binding domain-containing radical SAM protein [Planctomycetota bacterium]